MTITRQSSNKGQPAVSPHLKKPPPKNQETNNEVPRACARFHLTAPLDTFSQLLTDCCVIMALPNIKTDSPSCSDKNGGKPTGLFDI